MPTAISIRNLHKTFGSGKAATAAVNGINLEVAPGELFFLLGPSGCGKTTLLRMIAGFIDPTGGTILFNDKNVTHAPPNTRNTGMVFQSYALWPHMSVEQNVAFGLGVRKVPRPERKQRAQEALDAVQMGQYAKRKPNQLSGGQQQRVALARALVIRPDVLLLDEPLSNLDAKLRNDLRTEIRRTCKTYGAQNGQPGGITTIYVTHDQKEALSMADRIAVMRSGQIVQMGTPTDLYRRPRTRFVAEFLGQTNIIPATVAANGGGREGDLLSVTAASGPVRAEMPPETTMPPPSDGNKVLLSIRPESLRPASPNTPSPIRGTLVETTYLGEILHRTIELPDKTRVTIAELNPSPAALAQPLGSDVALMADPADVVVIPVE
ncbi:MAG: ABC transporter ATP-binding protein [Phycisphaeraceae bacterium]|nr:ABC transporter ATP-binding protein [Phycisphaeraceae bacterium]